MGRYIGYQSFLLPNVSTSHKNPILVSSMHNKLCLLRQARFSLVQAGKEVDCSVPAKDLQGFKIQPSPKIKEAEQEHAVLIKKRGRPLIAF